MSSLKPLHKFSNGVCSCGAARSNEECSLRWYALDLSVWQSFQAVWALPQARTICAYRLQQTSHWLVAVLMHLEEPQRCKGAPRRGSLAGAVPLPRPFLAAVRTHSGPHRLHNNCNYDKGRTLHDVGESIKVKKALMWMTDLTLFGKILPFRPSQRRSRP